MINFPAKFSIGSRKKQYLVCFCYFQTKLLCYSTGKILNKLNGAVLVLFNAVTALKQSEDFSNGAHLQLICGMDVNLTTSESYGKPLCCPFMGLRSLDSPAKGAHLSTNVALTVLNILLSILAFITNVLIVAAYIKNRHLRVASNMLPVILSASDIAVCAVALPAFISKKLAELFVVFNCFLWVFSKLAFYCCCGVSLMIIVVLSVERCITLAYPYRYQNIVTPNRLKIAVASSSVSVCTLTLCQLISLPYHTMPAIGAIAIMLSMAVVVSIWLWIHRVICRHRKCIGVFQTPSHVSTTTINNINMKVVQTTKTSHLIAGSVLFCYFPSFVSHIYYLLQPNNVDVYTFILPWLDTLVFANSFFNPLVLLYRKRDFRKTAKSLLFKKRPSNWISKSVLEEKN